MATSKQTNRTMEPGCDATEGGLCSFQSSNGRVCPIGIPAGSMSHGIGNTAAQLIIPEARVF